MPRNQIDFRHRAQLTELMDEPCSRELMRACLQDLARTNRWTFTHRPTLHWLNTIVDATPHLPSPLRILDVGSGYGDSLREIEQWAAKRRIAVELTGVDLNPDSAVIAAEAGPVSSRIQWVSADIFDYTPAEPVHVVLSSLFTHHLAGAPSFASSNGWKNTPRWDGSSTIFRAPRFPTTSSARFQKSLECTTSSNMMALCQLPDRSFPRSGDRCAWRPAFANRNFRSKVTFPRGSVSAGESACERLGQIERQPDNWGWPRRFDACHPPCVCRARSDTP
jgi:SAM-dependent methyltransferase